MIFCNQEFRRAFWAMCAIATAGAVTAWFLAGRVAALCVLAIAVALIAVFLVTTTARYRAIARLAAQVDDVLHGKRDVGFERMREGELAVLASELDKMRNRLTLAAEDLEHERNSLADSLADVSHQLKTPLTSLSLMTVNMRERMRAEDGRQSDVEQLLVMERLEGRVEWLTQALLKLARIDAGVVTFTRGTVLATDLVARAFDPVAVAYDLSDVEFTANVPSDATLECDLAWTAEALENILKNCLEHTPAGGKVTLSVKVDALACRIRVTDTGPGIADADLPHVFERFYRADKTGGSEPEPSGVGIGLALSQSLVTEQGGTVRAGNAPSGGAQFDIAFFRAVV